MATKFTNNNIPRDIIACCEWRPDDSRPWYKDGNIVYSKLTVLNEVFATVKEPYVLVTEEGDFSVYQAERDHYWIRHTNGYPLGYINKIPINVMAWYGTNFNFFDPRAYLLPFGSLKRHNDIIKQEPLKDPKTKELLYINFSPASSYKRRDLYYRVRNCEFATVEWPPSEVPPHVYERYFLNYIYMISMHKFTICPEGCGLDTFRIWEALSLGCIPILEHCYFSSYFKDLPVLIVNDFQEIDPIMLNQKYEEIMSKDWKLDQLTKQYWVDRIKKDSNETYE